MKNAFRLSVFYLALLISACNSFDQEAFDEGFENAQILEYTIPTTIPESNDQFKLLLHGTEKNQWVAKEFTLEGLLGAQDCRLDDIMTLRQDGTYQFDGGKMSCGGDDVVSKSGVYRIDYDNKKLIFDEGAADAVIVNVSGLAQGVIALDGEVSIFGVSMTIKGVYIAQQ